MKLSKGITAGVGFVTLAALLAACGGSKNATNDTNTWHRMEGDVISTMDASKNTDAISGQALDDTMEGLYHYEGKELKPGLATKVVTAGDNGLTYTYKLRNSTWSDGTKVTANDFVYAWQRTVDPKTKAQYAYLYSGIKNADAIMAGKAKPSTLGVKAVDDHTFEVTLEKPVPYFNTMMVNPAFFPQSQKAVAKYGAKYGTSSDHILTNGAYTLKGWNGTGNSWTEVKNPKYWNAKNIHINTIKTQVVKDSSTAMNLYNSKKLDQVTLSGQQAASARSNKDYRALKQSSVFYLELNEKKIPAFKNAKIRQAISYALDRDSYIKKVLNNGSLNAHVVTPAGLMSKPDDPNTDFAAVAAKDTKQYTDYDPAKAKSLFKQGLKEAGVSSLKVELMTDDTDNAKTTAEYLQNALSTNLPGLKVTTATVPFKTRLTRSSEGQFDMVITAWGADFPDAISFLDLFTSNNSYNDGKWSNPQYDALIAKSKGADANDPNKRWNDLLQAQNILTKDMGVVPIYQRVLTTLQRPNISGLTYSPANSFNYTGAKLK
ncbi:peptide ABC transporter substrate-binding protein [Lacticaseibacillus jixiensis]|uniref:peptide ABC transporter substrate-binding protein n=1 Tax=Lacticaseibacillus jixiensis TaxID=3231926 RepID=UPI0036F23DC3